MKSIISKHWLTILGLTIGALGGYIYYHFWGCTNGCPIKSSAWKMVLYGTFIGGLLFNMIQSEIAKRK